MPAHPASNCLDDCLVVQALAGLSVGMVLANPAGKVIWLNRAAEAVLGVKAPACIGQRITAVLKDPQLASFWHDAKGCGGTTHNDISVRWPRQLELRINCTQCTDRSGKLIGRALLFCDVTQDRAVHVQLSEAVANRLLDLTGKADAPRQPSCGLTTQELRVIRLLGRGLGNEDIARQISVSPSTVRSHLKSLYRKLGLSSRSEAVAYAVQNQLL